MHIFLKGIFASLASFSFLLPNSYALTIVPEGLPPEQAAALRSTYSELAKAKAEINRRVDALEKLTVVVGSQQEKDGIIEQGAIQKAKKAYQPKAETYERDLKLAIAKELKGIDGRIAKYRTRLKELTPKLLGFQDAVDVWVNQADAAREKARHSALEAVAKVLLASLGARKEHAIQLDENALKKINVIMRRRVFMDDLYAKVVTTERLVSLKSDLDVIHLIEEVQGGLVLAKTLGSKDREETAKALLQIIELVYRDPRVTLLIASGDIYIDAGCGWLTLKNSRERVNQLLDLGEDQFKEVNAITSHYKKDVDQRKLLQAASAKPAKRTP